MSSAARVPRGRRTTAAGLTALVAVLGLAWGAAEAIFLAAHRRTFWLAAPDATRFGRHTQFSDGIIPVIAVLIFVLGLLMVGVALVPPRRTLVELAETDDTVATGIDRRSLQHTLAAAAAELDGVSSATVSGSRRMRVDVTTALRDADTLAERVQERVTTRLDDLELRRRHAVRVRLEHEDA